MKIHKDDILESALTFGITPTMIRYSISREEIIEVLKWFKYDINPNIPCSCEIARNKGYDMTCMFCDKFTNERINI